MDKFNQQFDEETEKYINNLVGHFLSDEVSFILKKPTAEELKEVSKRMRLLKKQECNFEEKYTEEQIEYLVENFQNDGVLTFITKPSPDVLEEVSKRMSAQKKK